MPKTIDGEGYREFSEPRFFELESTADVAKIRNPVDKAHAILALPGGDLDIWKFDSSSSDAADGIDIIASLNPGVSGRWKRISGPVNILSMAGVVADGSTDVSTPINAAIAAVGASRPIRFPYGTYRASNIQVGLSQVLIFDNPLFEAASASAPVFNILRSDVTFLGKLRISGRALAGTIGLQLGGGADSVQQCYIENVYIVDCVTSGLYLYAASNDVIINHFNRVHVQRCGKNVYLLSPGATHAVNTNSFSTLSSQNCTSTALEIVRGDGNYIAKYEAEVNTGDAIVLTAAFGFGIGRGWLEGNTRNFVADNDTTGVYMGVDADSDFTSTDTKCVFTRTGIDRTLRFDMQGTSYVYGLWRNAGILRSGTNGTAANNQSVTPHEISGSVTVTDYSLAQPNFYILGQTGVVARVGGVDKLNIVASGVTPPVLTTAERDAFGAVADGRIIFNSTTTKLQVRAGAAWVDLH